MGIADDSIRETVKDKKGFKKVNLEKEAQIATNKQIGGDHFLL